jgi:ankyrin repeat protein
MKPNMYADSAETVSHYQRALEGSFLPAVAYLNTHPDQTANVIVDENQGLTLLHCACFYGNLKAIKVFIEMFRADCNKTDYRGQTPLHILVLSGNTDGLKYLCER